MPGNTDVHFLNLWIIRLGIDQLCNGSALDDHSTGGTKFLAAEAADAVFSMDLWQVVFHFYGMNGTDLRTFAAANAFVVDHDGICSNQSL